MLVFFVGALGSAMILPCYFFCNKDWEHILSLEHRFVDTLLLYCNG